MMLRSRTKRLFPPLWQALLCVALTVCASAAISSVLFTPHSTYVQHDFATLAPPPAAADVLTESCCAPRAGTSCVMRMETLPALRRARPLRIGFVTYATGPYGSFVEDLWASLRARAFVGDEVHLFVFSDRANDPTFLNDQRVHKRQQKRLGWPFDSLGRHFLYLAALDWFEDMDYLISVDADSVLSGTLTNDVLGERIATIQAWSFGHPKSDWTLDRRRTMMGVPYSSAFATDTEATCYFSGNLFGGTREGFFQLLREVVDLARADLSAYPRRVALWHDESYLNVALYLRAPSVIWGPNFMYPEPPADEWLYSGSNTAHMFWRGPRSTSSSTSDPNIRFPLAARAFLNFGVRKHSDHKLSEFQPLTSILPQEMSETGAEQRFPLPPPEAQVASMVTFFVRVAAVPAIGEPLATAMGQWCAQCCCKFLLPRGATATADFLPQCGNASSATAYAVVLAAETASELREPPTAAPGMTRDLANMLYVLESTRGPAMPRDLNGGERRGIDAVWGCVTTAMPRESPAAHSFLSDNTACTLGPIMYDSMEAACWDMGAHTLPLLVRIADLGHVLLETDSGKSGAVVARCRLLQ
jgi:hypothetical protein